MTPSEIAEILDFVKSGQYEEALGVEVGATRSQISRAHICRLNRYKNNPAIRESLNLARGMLWDESVVDRARRLLRLGKRDEALAHLLAAGDRAMGAEEHHLLGLTLHKLGRDREAVGHLELAAAGRGSAEDCLWLGYAHERLGNLEEALESYGKAVRSRGAAQECRQLGNVLMLLERYDEALPLLNRAASLGSPDHEIEERRRSIRARQRVRKVRNVAGRAASIFRMDRERAIDRVMFLIISGAGISILAGGEMIGLPLVFVGALFLLVR